MSPRFTRRENRLLLAGFALAALLSGAGALGQLERPGIYYDEVIQALPARAFLEDAAPAPIPGRRGVPLFGRWLPWMTQPYMGALKSQALIGPFALFGATPRTLRTTTWLWTLCGIAAAMLLARELLGTGPALLAGALLALDPSVLFLGRHDWGSFALAFLCRGAGLWLLVRGWRGDSMARLALGGGVLGLGLYNKIDFALFLLAAALAWLAALGPGRVASRRMAAAAAGLVLGAAPLWAALPEALASARAMAAGGAWRPGEKLSSLVATLDGSYFERLILAGGSFEALGRVEGAARGGFGLLLAASLAFLLWRLLRLRGDDGRRRAHAFLTGCVLLSLGGYGLLPGAERAHHVMVVAPLAQLVFAAALAELWRLGGRRGGLRAAAVGLAALTLLSAARVDLHTLATLRETGGRGRWSDALGRFAADLAPGSAVVALDWGFGEPLRFLAPELAVVEPFWALRRPGSGFVLEGSPDHVYLWPLPELAVFGHGAGFREALAALPPAAVRIQEVADRNGRGAFLAARIARPHRLDYRGSFEVRLR